VKTTKFQFNEIFSLKCKTR